MNKEQRREWNRLERRYKRLKRWAEKYIRRTNAYIILMDDIFEAEKRIYQEAYGDDQEDEP